MKNTVALAPINSGMISRSFAKISVFTVPFSAALLRVTTTAGQVPQLGDLAGVTQQAQVGLSPFITTATASAAFPCCFPPEIQRLSTCFSRYRIKPGSATLSYRGAVATTTYGTLALEVIPSDYATSSNPSYQSVSSGECSLITPPWVPSVEFNRQRLGSVITTDASWKYCDMNGTVSQPEQRQDLAFNIAAVGFNLPASSVIGYLFMDVVLEFQHLQDEPSLVQAKQPLPTVSSSELPSASVATTSPSVTSSINEVDEYVSLSREDLIATLKNIKT